MQSPEIDATRSRLLEAAGPVFAEKGFAAATVRQICQKADANVAAVNYHFRDKMGLYVAVLQESMALAAEEDLQELDRAGKTPEAAITLLISGMLQRLSRPDQRAAWHVRIMAHELSQPTPALRRVATEVIGPRYALLRDVIARIIGLPADHDTTRFCAHSVIGQVIHYAHARPVIGCIWPDLVFTSERIAQIAAHIAAFSLAGLAAVASTQHRQET